MRVIHLNSFRLEDGMRNAPFNYLDTETGRIVRANIIYDLNENPIDASYNIDINNIRFIRIPSIEPYLRKQYLERLKLANQTLMKYGTLIDDIIECYLLCGVNEFYNIYADYIGKSHVLCEEIRAERHYQQYADVRAKELELEWFKNQRITVIN